LADAKAASEAGAFAMVLECIPAAIAKAITEAIPIPTIGIGAGPDCDGQVLVTHDVLGLTSGYVPSFVRPYANLRETINEALVRFRDDVQAGKFPGEAETFQ
jgi:3-methyl-2-oxobutanoate hydroxymethyltransferase